MKIKNVLLWVSMAVYSVGAMAEDNHLYIQPGAGETLSWSVPSLQKMTFQNGNLVLTMKNGTSSYTPIMSIERIYIGTPSEIQGIEEVDNAPLYSWDGETLILNAQSGAQVRVYNVAGAVVKQERLTGNSINLPGLAKGLYVVNVDGHIFKTIKK